MEGGGEEEVVEDEEEPGQVGEDLTVKDCNEAEDGVHDEAPDRCWNIHQSSMEQSEDSPGQVLQETSSGGRVVGCGTQMVGGVAWLDRSQKVVGDCGVEQDVAGEEREDLGEAEMEEVEAGGEGQDRCWSIHQSSRERSEDSLGLEHLQTSSGGRVVWHGTHGVAGVGWRGRLERVGVEDVEGRSCGEGGGACDVGGEESLDMEDGGP